MRKQWKSLRKEDSPQDSIQLLEELDELLRTYRIPCSMQEDRLIWDKTVNGSFSIKSAYNQLFSNDPNPSNWGLVWNNNLLPKINFFWWTVQHGKILITDNLKKRGFVLPNRCYLCKNNEESIKHLFLECPFSQRIWSTV